MKDKEFYTPPPVKCVRCFDGVFSFYTGMANGEGMQLSDTIQIPCPECGLMREVQT